MDPVARWTHSTPVRCGVDPIRVPRAWGRGVYRGRERREDDAEERESRVCGVCVCMCVCVRGPPGVSLSVSVSVPHGARRGAAGVKTCTWS
jgi:hypothetical protein